MNHAPAAATGDAKTAKELTDKHGSRWQAFSLKQPVVVGAQPGGTDAFAFNYSFSPSLPFTPAGSPMPDKLATRVAVQVDRDAGSSRL